MPLYMDIHRNVEGLTADAVADAHQKDLEVQGEHESTTSSTGSTRRRARSSAWLRPRARRRTMLLLALVATVLVCADGVAWAATIIGNDADNTLKGTRQADRINGRGGDDTLLARRGRDQLIGGADNDTLNGASGNDAYVFTDNWGSDVIFLDGEGAGTDTLDFSALTVSGSTVELEVRLEASTSLDEAELGANTLNFPSTVEIEKVTGGPEHEVIFGNDASNRLRSNGGLDGLHGLGGDDALNGGTSNDYYVFEDGWGSDTITADASGSDSLTFTGTLPVVVDLEPLEGRFEATSGQSTLDFPSTVIIENVIAGDAGDVIRGNESQNDLAGYFGDDVLYGLGGDDLLYGDDGNDDLTGYGGEAYISGGFGDDEIFAQDGEPDKILCGGGNDVAHYDPAPAGGASPDTFLDGSCETTDDTMN
jgi:Ca2+-binding RTX toxin-like protein